MSSSKFKILNQPEAKNLVIVVNKSGQVSTDTEILQNLLTNEEDIETGISILRETSPTPSITEEVLALEKSNLEEFLDEDDDDEPKSKKPAKAGTFPHATLRMESFISPSEARKFANDVLHLGGVDPQSLLLPIDFEFRRKVVMNDHCYTNLMFTGDKKKSTATSSKKASSSAKASESHSKSSSSKSSNVKERKVQNESEESENDDEKQEEVEGEEEEEEEEISYSESDDEDDMDFNVNDRFGKKGKRKRKYRKHKQKASTFKDFLETGEIAIPEENEKKKYGGKKYGKKSNTSPAKAPANTNKLLQVDSSPFKTNRNLIKKSTPQSSSKDLSTLSFSVLEKGELDANFGMPKVKTEVIEKPVLIAQQPNNNPSSKNLQAQAKDKEKEIVDSIAKDLETSFPDVTTSSTSSLQTPQDNCPKKIEKIPESSSIDLSQIKELDSTDEEIGDAIIAVLGEKALDELLNQSELINFDANQTQTSNNEVSLVNLSEISSPISNVSTPSKDPTTTIIKQEKLTVVRNGRVIVLPPIEKPATRGSKRKSLSDPPTTPVAAISTKVIKIEKPTTPKESSDSRNSSRRSSLNKSESGRSRLSTGGGGDDETDDLVSDASFASEDDPERLWCICKQPHNNRFMICCDKCEEWYHGKCVNVSKAMGKVIEAGKKEWVCPTCKTGAPPQIQSDKDKKPLNQSKLTKFFAKNNQKAENDKKLCVVCKKNSARIHSIYCSDECIQNHAKLTTTTEEKVVDESGKTKTFEKEHHNFLLQSESMRNQLKLKSETKSVSTLFSNPVKIQTNSTNNVVNVVNTNKNVVIVKKSLPKSSPPNPANRPQQQVVKSKDEKPVFSKSMSEKARAGEERKNVRNILANTLKTRMKDFNHPEIPKMTDEKIDEFAEKVELEMFIYFNRDTRDKYKTKYRSLKFNLGDVKNKTLLEKICSNKIAPKQLVTLTSADLASEDLAKWREYENKHQLEIITKSELESLAQTKLVIKSHKGEEIIESKSQTKDLAIQDVELVISKTVLKVDDHSNLNVNTINSVDQESKSRSRKRSRSRDRHHKSSHSKHRRSRSPRNSTKSSSKSHSDKSKRSSDHKHNKRSRSRSKSRDKSKRHDEHHHKSSEKHEKHHKDHHHHHSEKSEKNEKVGAKIAAEIIPEKQDVDLVGKILDSMGVHVNLERKEPTKLPEEQTKIEEPQAQEPPKETIKVVELTEQQPKEIQIFSGVLTVPDFHSFDIIASKVSGNFDDTQDVFNNLVSPQLDMIGRIEPHSVWDYIEKVKKSPGKEICILRFSSTDESAYFHTFNNLLTRQRFGVIKMQNPKIKDFYIIPLEAKSSLPKILLPLTGPGFIEGEDSKPNLLIGVIIKILQDVRTKKSSTVYRQKKSEKSAKSSSHSSSINQEMNEIRTKNKQSSILTMGLPQLTTAPLNTSTDDKNEEPYEPYDDDIPSSTSNANPPKNDDLETQMKLLDRQIEERRMEIHNLAQNKLLELDEEEAKRIYENIVVPDNLTEILSKITSASSTANYQQNASVDEEYVPSLVSDMYTPTSTSTHQPHVNEMMDIDERVFQPQMPPIRYDNSDNGVSRLRGMTTQELLKLVPDDETI